VQADLGAQPHFCAPPAFSLAGAGKRETAAQAEGRRYEEKALPFLEAWCRGNGYKPLVKPWIEYRDLLGRVRYCQPDCLGVGETTDNLMLFEVKLRHTRAAFHQMGMYRALLVELFPKHHIISLEICRYFDRSEYACKLLTEVSAHDLPFAAAVFEPRSDLPGIN
jgi:hypothetical protein